MPFSHGLFDCFDEGCSLECCLAFFLTARTYGKIVESLSSDDAADHCVCCPGKCFLPGCCFCITDIIGHVSPPCLLLGAFIHMGARLALKKKYNITEFEPDYCIALCCKCCAVLQEIREVKHFSEAKALSSI